MSNPRFVGLDVHKRVVEACILRKDGEIVLRERFALTRETLTRFAGARLGKQDQVALEATTNTWAVVDVLTPFVDKVVVSNPLKTKAIAEAKVKTDKVDALVLAQLLRCDYLPDVWQPDLQTRRLRQQTHYRAALVADKTAVKNRVRSTLAQRLIVEPVHDIFHGNGLAWLRQLELDPDGRQALDSDLRLFEGLERELLALDLTLAKGGYQDERVKLLMTLPGFDVAVATTLLAAIGDVKRFEDGDHMAAYLGLTPATYQSAEHCFHGPITKHGSGHARWMLVQAAQHLRTHPGPLGAFFHKLAHKKNYNVAVVAVARKLVVIAWHMLTKDEPYRYAIPRTTETKLARLRVRATGQKKKTGPATTKRPTRCAVPGGVRVIPSLREVYQREGLPPPADLTPAEVRALRAKKVLGAIAALGRSHVEPRSKGVRKNQVAPEH